MKIILIGMAGVGKSYIGKLLAAKLNYNFVDIDDSLKEKTGLGTTELLEKVGDEKFLEIESETFQEELDRAKTGTVFAPGGSIVYCQSFIGNLPAGRITKDKIKVIYLVGDLNVILERIKKEPRGIVYSSLKPLDELFLERAKLYEKFSDFVVDSKQDSEAVIKQICDTIFIENN